MTNHPHLRAPDALYGYIPTEWICALFIALFGASSLAHLTQALYYRTWWMLPTAILAGLGEVIGWGGRLWSSKNVSLLTPFLVQIVTTVISPTFLVAANFVMLGKLMKLVGNEYSRLGPNQYTIIFICIDIVALIVQAIGGASAASALQQEKSTVRGSHILLGGIVFQMISILVYTTLALEFLTRVLLRRPIKGRVLKKSDRNGSMGSTSPTGTMTVDKPGAEDEKSSRDDEEIFENISWKRVKLVVFTLGFSTLCVFIRSVYRTIELSEGFAGSINHKQHLFNWLDGAMIVLALTASNFLHPGRLLSNSRGW